MLWRDSVRLLDQLIYNSYSTFWIPEWPRYPKCARRKNIKLLISLSYFEDFSYFTYTSPSLTFEGPAIFLSAILLKDTYQSLSDYTSLVEILSQSHRSRLPLCHLTMPNFALIPRFEFTSRQSRDWHTTTYNLTLKLVA